MIRQAVNALLDYAEAEEVDQNLADQLATALENTLMYLAQRDEHAAQLMGYYRRELERIYARENEL